MEVPMENGSPFRSPKGLIAVPARRASTRLPNKLLLAETGRPLLAHVLEQCKEAVRHSAGRLDAVVLAYDDEALGEIARAAGVRAVRTGEHHRCGTTRIAEAVGRLEANAAYSFVVNVQGDEPEISPRAILRVAEELLADPEADMSTLAIPMPAGTGEKKANPNAVKAVIDRGGRAIYFSRAAVPFDRNPPAASEALWHHHLGIYAYRREFLFEFAALPASPLEEREGLEQLRAIEAGRRIKVGLIPADWAGKGIDTPEDYAAFVRRWAGRPRSAA